MNQDKKPLAFVSGFFHEIFLLMKRRKIYACI